MLRLWSNIEFNSVIKHINRKIRRKDSKDHFIYNSDFTPVYSHPLPSHILRKNPYFDGRVQIKNSLYEKLGVDLQHLLQCQLEVVPVPGEQLISKEKRLLKHLKQSHKPFSIF